MEVDREEQRQRQMKEQERRAKENEELFKRQRVGVPCNRNIFNVKELFFFEG